MINVSLPALRSSRGRLASRRQHMDMLALTDIGAVAYLLPVTGSPVQRGDTKGALLLMDALPPVTVLLGAEGDLVDWLRDSLEGNGIATCIQSRSVRMICACHDRMHYKQRHQIENLFARLTDRRRIAIP